MKTFMGLQIEQSPEENRTYLLGWEPYFEKYRRVATIFHSLKEVIPCHGYFYPHKYGVISKKYAKKIGYKFNNQ